MKKPRNIRIINDDGFFRLKYESKDIEITSKGFTNRKELAKIIAEDEFFRLDIS